MSTSSLEKVREFYKGFKQDEFIAERAGLDPENISEERVHLKMALIAEEFFELVGAVYGGKAAQIVQNAWARAVEEDEHNRDIVETADAIADLIYVLHGLEIEAGIPGDEIFDEVHRSNMSKLDENGEPIISDGVTPSEYDGLVKPAGKILKSKRYFEANLKGIIEAHS